MQRMFCSECHLLKPLLKPNVHSLKFASDLILNFTSIKIKLDLSQNQLSLELRLISFQVQSDLILINES